MVVDLIRRMLGLDVPFRATDITPPAAVSDVVRLMDRLEAAERLAQARRELLLRVVHPYRADGHGSPELRTEIRRHLRETRHV